ncbi:MAG: spore germination protein GerW family protein [Dehalococcoidales bacterium]|nr:spore germination protein GerW family protein [Dehalococcoidales bacterium]
METVENLVKATLGEIEKVLTTRTVVGEPINIQGRTLIPLVSVGFGFGAGAGEGKGEGRRMGEGSGGGAGGGAWIRPMALVIIDKDGVKVESVRGGLASAVEKFAEAIPIATEKGMEARERMKKEDAG